jgi:catechol 2,3-dioxygenase-like lactoylglutathione lyase family enzyme
LRYKLFDLRFAVASKSAVRTKRATKPAKKPARGTSSKPAKTSARAAPSRSRSPAKPAPARARPAKPASASKPARPTASPARARPRANGGGEAVIDGLHQVALQALNLDAAIDFYRDILGLRFIARFDPPGLAFFDMGGFRLLLSATASEATLYFRVDDIGDAVKFLKKRGVSFLHPPAMIHRDDAGEFGKKGVEEWMAFFKDPSGNLLALTERR